MLCNSMESSLKRVSSPLSVTDESNTPSLKFWYFCCGPRTRTIDSFRYTSLLFSFHEKKRGSGEVVSVGRSLGLERWQGGHRESERHGVPIMVPEPLASWRSGSLQGDLSAIVPFF